MKNLGNKGFTLIEVIIASSILIVAAFSSFFLISSLASGAINSINATSSLYIALGKMEELRSFEFDSLAPLDGTTFNNMAGKIFVQKIQPDLLKLQLTYKWNASKAPIELYSKRSKYE